MLFDLPLALAKNTDLTFILNKADLLAHAAVDADEYYKLSENWKKVIARYKSTTGNQLLLVSFPIDNPVNATFNGSGFVVTEALDIFQLVSLTIHDKQLGKFKIVRNDIVDVVDYDLDFNPPPLFVRDFIVDNAYLPNDSESDLQNYLNFDAEGLHMLAPANMGFAVSQRTGGMGLNAHTNYLVKVHYTVNAWTEDITNPPNPVPITFYPQRTNGGLDLLTPLNTNQTYIFQAADKTVGDHVVEMSFSRHPAQTFEALEWIMGRAAIGFDVEFKKIEVFSAD